MARLKKKAEAEVSEDGEIGLRGMKKAPDQELITMLESGEITEEMVGELPQNHPVRNRLMQLQKQIKKDLAGQTGLKEFRGNIMGALRWATFFEWGVSKLDAMKQAMAISDRAKDAQAIMQARTAGEQILKLVQGGQVPQMAAPAREAQKQGMAIGGGGGAPRQDLATLIAAAKKQLAEKAAKAEQVKGDGKPAVVQPAKAAPSLNVPIDPKAKAAEALKAKQAQEAEQQDKQKAGG